MSLPPADARRVRPARGPGRRARPAPLRRRAAGPTRTLMSAAGPAIGQVAVLVGALAVAAPPRAPPGPRPPSPKHLAVERASYRCCGSTPTPTSTGAPTRCRCSASLVGVLALYAIGRLQEHLPLNLGFAAPPADGAWNTAVSFVTNTNWQWYSGESTVGHLMQMSGLTVQNFVSAAVGMAVAAPSPAVWPRNLAGGGSATSGPTWCGRSCGSCCRSPWSRRSCWSSSAWCRTCWSPRVYTLTGGTQSITGAPVASQGGDQGLGTNGGGFANANSAHPVREPDAVHGPVRGLPAPGHPVLDGLGLLASSSATSARAARSPAVMALLWGGAVAAHLGRDGRARHRSPAGGRGHGGQGGNPPSARPPRPGLFASSTTGTSTGAVNAMHDSLTARRRVADIQHDARRDRPRRCRLRPLRHP